MTTDQTPEAGLDAYVTGLAAEFVQNRKNAGVSLDFLPRTLPLVDKYLAADRQQAQQQTREIGAYLGEVIRKETGGQWYEHEGNPALDVGEHQVDPLAALAELVEKGQAQFGDVTIQTTKQYCEWVCRLHRQWLDRTLLGRFESMAALRTSMTTDAKLAGALVAQSQSAVQTGRLTWGETLDFTPDSLDAIERMLGKVHNTCKYTASGLNEEQLAAAAKLWGIYIGEVIRRFYGGQWAAGAGDELSLSIGEATVLPVAKARKRIVDGPTENIRYYFSSIEKVLQG
jgi:hypothetical protein